MTEVTYARLEETLLSLGFSPYGVHEKNKIFRHDETGALVIYPDFPSGNAVLPRHLLAIKSILQAYDISDPDRFFLELQKAS